MFKYLVLALIVFLPLNQSSAQNKNIKISIDSLAEGYDEESIAINPVFPDNVIIGSNIEHCFYTLDGGKTWKQQKLESTYGVWGDPCIVFNSKGTAFYGHLSNPTNTFDNWIDRIVVQKSADNGLNWNSGSGIGLNGKKKQDKEWIAVDTRNSRDILYCFWTEFDKYAFDTLQLTSNDRTRIRFSSSSNNGDSWADGITISDTTGICIDSDFAVEGVSPAVGVDGEIYVTWCFDHKMFFDKSTDGGKTFGTDKVISNQYNGWDLNIQGVMRANGFPVLLCDTANSKFRGNLYLMFSDQRNGDLNTDVFLMKSTDKGENWSEIKKVNSDNSGRHQFFPWMSLDPLTGYLYIVYYDRRNTQGADTEVYLSRSKDGGESFEDFKISDSSFRCSNKIFLGDYISAGAYHGKVYSAWTRIENNRTNIYLNKFEEDLTDFEEIESIPEKMEIKAIFPNPSSNSFLVDYYLDTPSAALFELFDSKGSEVYRYDPGFQKAAEYKFELDASGLAAGIYYLKMSCNGKISSKTCIINK